MYDLFCECCKRDYLGKDLDQRYCLSCRKVEGPYHSDNGGIRCPFCRKEFSKEPEDSRGDLAPEGVTTKCLCPDCNHSFQIQEIPIIEWEFISPTALSRVEWEKMKEKINE